MFMADTLSRYRLKVGVLFALLALEVCGFFHVGQHVVAHKLWPHEKIRPEGVYDGVALIVNEAL